MRTHAPRMEITPTHWRALCGRTVRACDVSSLPECLTCQKKSQLLRQLDVTYPTPEGTDAR